jgi:hypothetical protein
MLFCATNRHAVDVSPAQDARFGGREYPWASGCGRRARWRRGAPKQGRGDCSPYPVPARVSPG